ncbi:MAG: hypothetical protein EBS92_06840 [Proteobacteria bacterium]|nr:hypothetical protein [Pseudomonadota bacterium]
MQETNFGCKIAPDRFGLCVVKWTAKYGYNAIAETKKVYPKGVFGFFNYEKTIPNITINFTL